MNKTETILSFPPAAAQSWSHDIKSVSFAASDPPGRQLGSGGGTANIIAEAWKASRSGVPFKDWLRASRKLIIHGSGQSRRLPAYAAEGKIMLPLPRLASITGQNISQTLLDLQQSDYTHLMRHAPDQYCIVVACGDVLIREENALPVFPDADVLIAGIPASPEEARNHGVMFCYSDKPNDLEFFLQKPTAERISELSGKFSYYLDTGIWFLTEHAIDVLMAKCGWNSATESFQEGVAGSYELFDSFGTALGNSPVDRDDEIATLQSAVLPLPNGRFYHFGTNRSVFSSIAQLAHPAESRRSFGHSAKDPSYDRIIINSNATVAESVHPLWIENSTIPASWTLHSEHVLTGVPSNHWTLEMPHGACLDMLNMQGLCGQVIRVYGFSDTFKGAIGDLRTKWMGKPSQTWFDARGLTLAEVGIDAALDIQNARLFPVIDAASPEAPKLIQWMLSPSDSTEMRALWLNAPRVSATDIVQNADLAPRFSQRAAHIRRNIEDMPSDRWESSCLQLDLEATAELVGDLGLTPPAPISDAAEPSLAGVHDAMFRSMLKTGSDASRDNAFAKLRRMMIDEMTLQPVRPARNILDDQIVWGRSPARLDLAGGWSDTPPYCIEHGGRVVNVAVNLNGQPPIQAFVRLCETPHIVLHSIDLGISESIKTYEDLVCPSTLGGFSIARAALRLAGFDPMFHANGGAKSLQQQLLTEFGGGIELSMLAAIPKGSGLGTSSILAATILGVLGEICSHNWTHRDIFARTSVLEQILTSGGGWQDQVGGITAGVKLNTTHADLSQSPDIRWLPDKVLQDDIVSGRALLYYTGITRLARNILSEIVRGIFLNNRRTIATIEDIAYNADFTADAIQRNDSTTLREAIRRSWNLNCTLDNGTCPPPVQNIVDRIAPFNPSFKLLGAGGGGYMLILASDVAAAAAISETLQMNPSNPQARFVSLEISQTGMQITRS